MNTHVTEIRRAELADAGEISAVHLAAWQGAYRGIIPHRSLNTMLHRRGADWWARAIRRSTQILVADIGGVIAGYATLGPNRARQLPQKGEVYELYIRPEYQGLGLGTRLLGASRRSLVDQGLKGMVVWALEDNDLAINFYQNAGGKDVAEGVECFEGKTLKKIAFVWN
ncbi:MULTISPECIES: GNAT family N-acetyltransferase [unclassified Phyllobacterium]|uniref:GNAT family N-acetyltransferase n=1 Tax=Phyllobacterium TaxID=28100 RepID=UPI000DD5B312|nr:MULTISPECIES: GNAT family N-acetyltransferase [unclassified Phyllobacterium]MBA8899931.1 ribosomal protein S18 acetylase RimI-like enzyme [Phyllobacterium sp. P30BS-XVII]UGX85903.1 GNAT family N-acetyltransferase [Phyllobacterium sp. T1293]